MWAKTQFPVPWGGIFPGGLVGGGGCGGGCGGDFEATYIEP